MSFKEINELRQAGKLSEAWQMANQALESDSANIWNKRAAAWVYYDYLKQYARPETFDSFEETLIKLRDLKLPEDENMVFDSCAWQIGLLVFALQKTDAIDYGKINKLFSIIKAFSFTKPSEAYTFLYKAFHKGYLKWSNYLSFADWWDFKHFRSEDYLKEEFKGKNIMSTVERAYIAYAKKLLEGNAVDSFGFQVVIDKAKIHSFLPMMDDLIEQYPAFQYPPYFKAKLLLALGSEENVLSAFLPFAKQKRNDFWVWGMMADIFHDDKDLQFSCYCKALSLKTSDDFLIKIRQSFAEMLIEREMFDDANVEIQKIIATRSRQNWKIPTQIAKWQKQQWYKPSIAQKDNKALYLRHKNQAEELLFQDIPEELIVVEFVNSKKKMLNFIKDKRKFGFFNYSRFLKNPQIGDLLYVRFNGAGRDRSCRILSAKKAKKDVESPLLKDFSGVINIVSPHNFGFANDVFINSKIVNNKNLIQGQLVEGKAMLSFNKKKEDWGWKAIEIL